MFAKIFLSHTSLQLGIEIILYLVLRVVLTQFGLPKNDCCYIVAFNYRITLQNLKSVLSRLQGQSRFWDNLAKDNLSSTGGMDMTGSMNDKKLHQGLKEWLALTIIIISANDNNNYYC